MMRVATFFLGMFFLFCSCADKNDDETIDAALQGEWVLSNVSCFCYFGENPDFGSHKLIFDSPAQKVIIVNQGKSPYFHDEGKYTYVHKNDTISINGDDRSYTYKIEGNNLTLTYIDEPMIADDEISFRYIR